MAGDGVVSKTNQGEEKPIYFLSLVGTSARENGKHLPPNATYVYDIMSELELLPYGIKFLSGKDLFRYYKKCQKEQKNQDVLRRKNPKKRRREARQNQTPKSIQQKNIYDMVNYFMSKNPNGYYFCDEVPILVGWCLYFRYSFRIYYIRALFYKYFDNSFASC